MQSPVTLEVGKKAFPTYSALDQNGQPYSAFTVTIPPPISDPTVIGWDNQAGFMFGLATGVGKSADATFVFVDSNDPSKTVTKTETFNVVAPTLFLASASIDWTVS